MGPNIEPCGIPDKSMWKALSVSLIFAPCFPRFKHECTKVKINHTHEVLQQVNHDLTLERSIRTVPTKYLLSPIFFKYSVSFNKTWFEL